MPSRRCFASELRLATWRSVSGLGLLDISCGRNDADIVQLSDHEYDLGPGMFKGYLLNGAAEAVMPLNDSQWVSQIEPNMAYYRPWKSNVDDDADEVDDDDDEPALMPSSVDDGAPTLRRRTDIRPLRKKDNLWNLEQISGGHKLQYHCPDGCGAGTFIYFIDDGIDHDHPEFAGRIVSEQHFHPGVPTQ